ESGSAPPHRPAGVNEESEEDRDGEVARKPFDPRRRRAERGEGRGDREEKDGRENEESPRRRDQDSSQAAPEASREMRSGHVLRQGKRGPPVRRGIPE